MTFPELDAPKRTDRTFRDREDVLHHVGHSPFENLQLDMIALFPLDYMHVVCLGVMRRLLQAWLRGRGCLSTAQKQMLTERLELCGKSFPPYFQRKPRGVDVVERWKATEFRSFLLYVGPIVLKGLLPDAEYKHFLVLHVTVKILASPAFYLEYHTFARDLLFFFVQEYGTSALYGERQLTYNVHSLSHLAGDCLSHGPLDAFSAFAFESFLGKLKPLLRTKSAPLAQVSRRISEHTVGTCFPAPKRVLHVVRKGNCYLINRKPVVIMEVSETTCKAAPLSNIRDFFTYPLPSSVIDIFKTSGQGTCVKELELAVLNKAQQCLILPSKSSRVVLPLLHMQ
ncbi:unnamed protein product [Ixodes pacificus]